MEAYSILVSVPVFLVLIGFYKNLFGLGWSLAWGVLGLKMHYIERCVEFKFIVHIFSG